MRSQALSETSRAAIRARTARREASPRGLALGHYWQRAQWEQNRRYQPGLVLAEDPWLWDAVVSPGTRNYSLGVSGLATSSEPSRLQVWLQGGSDFAVAPDHHLRLYVKGYLVAEAGVLEGAFSQFGEADHSYLAVSPEAVLRPELRQATPASLAKPDNGAEYLLLAPREFLGLEQAASLLEQRRAQGLSARGVAIEDVFDEFGHGEARPEAVKEFLSHAYHSWPEPSPRYVLLLGDASYDPEDNLNTGTPNHVADNADHAGNFEADAEWLAAGVLADRDPEKIYLSQLGAATRPTIVEAFDRGASLLSYIGHGAILLWASENVFNFADVATLSPQPQQPLVMMLNCLNGYFHFPYLDSLAEALVKAEGKGAIATFSPSGMSVNGPASVYHEALLAELVSGRHERLGDAVLAAQVTYANNGALPELLSLYHLFGDPALVIQ